MKLFPFGGTLPDQLEALEYGMERLREFSQRFPHLKPFSCSPVGPSCYFDSSSAAALKKAFGSEGWEHGHRLIHRVELGVRVEMELPATAQPYRL